jgi:hypothetical protein
MLYIRIDSMAGGTTANVCRFFFFFGMTSAFMGSILLRPSPVVKSIVCRVCLETKRSCSGGGDNGFCMYVSDARCEARTSLAINAMASCGDGFDDEPFIIGVDVQTGAVFVERTGDDDNRGQFT